MITDFTDGGFLGATLVCVAAILVLGRLLHALVGRPVRLGSTELTPRQHRRSATRRRVAPSPGSVAEWASDLSRHLRGGTTLREALRTVGPSDPPTRDHTADLRLAIERGRSIHDAVVALPVGHDSPHFEVVAAVLLSCHQAGGSAAEPLGAWV